jgi:DNA-binding MarR family transcriptional regulator
MIKQPRGLCPEKSITTSGRQLLRRVEEELEAAEPGVLASLTYEQRSEIHKSATQVLAQYGPEAWIGPS